MQAPVECATAGVELATESLRQLRATVPVLGEVARSLPRVADALERLAEVANALDGPAGTVAHLERLAELADRAAAVADDPDARDELARALDAVQRIAAATTVDTQPRRVRLDEPIRPTSQPEHRTRPGRA